MDLTGRAMENPKLIVLVSLCPAPPDSAGGQSSPVRSTPTHPPQMTSKWNQQVSHSSVSKQSLTCRYYIITWLHCILHYLCAYCIRCTVWLAAMCTHCQIWVCSVCVKQLLLKVLRHWRNTSAPRFFPWKWLILLDTTFRTPPFILILKALSAPQAVSPYD